MHRHVTCTVSFAIQAAAHWLQGYFKWKAMFTDIVILCFVVLQYAKFCVLFFLLDTSKTSFCWLPLYRLSAFYQTISGCFYCWWVSGGEKKERKNTDHMMCNIYLILLMLSRCCKHLWLIQGGCRKQTPKHAFLCIITVIWLNQILHRIYDFINCVLPLVQKLLNNMSWQDCCNVFDCCYE